MPSEHRGPSPSGSLPRRLFLLGAGGHASVVLDMLLTLGLEVEGVVDRDLNAGDMWEGIPVLGGDESLMAIPPDGCRLVNGLGANPDVRARNSLFARFHGEGFAFESLVHPAAVVGRNVRMGEGCQVMAGAVLQGGVSLGANTVVNTRASVDHHSEVGEGAFLSPGAVLCGGVRVRDGAFIGAGAVLLPGVHVGEMAVVGAGAVVVSPVPDRTTVVGNPARHLHRME